MTGGPAAFSALAFASTARVADSDMADTRADILVVGMPPIVPSPGRRPPTCFPTAITEAPGLRSEPRHRTRRCGLCTTTYTNHSGRAPSPSPAEPQVLRFLRRPPVGRLRR